MHLIDVSDGLDPGKAREAFEKERGHPEGNLQSGPKGSLREREGVTPRAKGKLSMTLRVSSSFLLLTDRASSHLLYFTPTRGMLLFSDINSTGKEGVGKLIKASVGK